MIRLEDVWKVYDKKGTEVRALAGVSVALEDHEYVSMNT